MSDKQPDPKKVLDGIFLRRPPTGLLDTSRAAEATTEPLTVEDLHFTMWDMESK